MTDEQLDRLRAELREKGECNLGFLPALADVVQLVDGLGLRYDELTLGGDSVEEIWLRHGG